MASAKDIENRRPITASLMLATLMNTLDSTIANVALPHIQGSVSAAQDQITWVLTSYIIALAIMTPLSGWLAQKIGRKRMFQMSIFGFTVASMLCGIATSLPEIVFFRLLQGIAGASMMPLSQSVMLDIFPPKQIPQVMALWSSAVILGPIIGPALGGWLTEDLSWRWVFFINLPIGILAFIGLNIFMDDDPGGRERPFDFLGFGALVAFIGGFQLMLDRGPGQDWFGSPEIWIEAVVAGVGFWVFVVQTITAEHPFFHRALARDRNFATTTIFSFCTGALLYASSALLPSMMQNQMGYSVLQSGFASMPRGLGSLVAFLSVPALMKRFGARPVLLAGLLISMVALWQMSRFDLMMTASPIMVSGLIQGLGTGLLFAPLTSLAYVTLSPAHRTEGTVLSTMARSLGSSVGISVMQAVVISQSAVAHSALSADIQPSSPVFRSVNPAVMNPADPLGMALLNSEVSRQAAMLAYDWVFGAMILMVMGMIPLLLVIQPPAAPAPTPLEAVE
jgi:DHA2 family multidrug resistance protein